MTLTHKIVLAAAAFTLTAGVASAECMNGAKMRTAAASEAPAKPVDVASLITPSASAETEAAKRKLLPPQTAETAVK